MLLTKPSILNEKEVVNTIQKHAHPLNNIKDLKPLFDRIGDARIVMLGEASHGTHEYYTWRAHISKKLIEEKGFNFIAVEGDWPDCYRLNRYVKGYESDDKDAVEVLKDFNRWPTWMWANWEVVALAEWLKQHNKGLSAHKKTGIYGLDVYSLWESMESIMQYLEKTDPAAYHLAEDAFRCFEPYRKDEGRSYAEALNFVPKLCQNEVVNLLKEVRRRMPLYDSDFENVFSAEQNALVAVNAEKYYEAMLAGGANSWNVRDQHMASTLDRLLTFYGENSKAIVWEHNTHIGDARATNMQTDGMYNIGQLARFQHQNKGVVLVGFGSYEGSVMAGNGWGAPMKTMPVPAATKGSWEYFLHQAGAKNKLLIMANFKNNDAMMKNYIGHRAIGVVYHPEFEHRGNYVPSILPSRYDAFIYLDKTKALHPLNTKADTQQMPGTYPFGV
ncbi:erythromycin esterase family protein [Pedobacter cryophilus]|uniref:Erythromycin esterase family protein n=1 Tax=Pedobacter cryophilus TaxID=2571271 RepID=A0A4U1BYZ1_9SPHI|nr:erythromycin esterase family protein [Pedobacter cryophilus]TKB96903.1 erythromycin esterase family protein [Pedobacter cryophilus]